MRDARYPQVDAVSQGLTFSSGITPASRALASSETRGRFADRVLLATEPYRFTEKHLIEVAARFGAVAADWLSADRTCAVDPLTGHVRNIAANRLRRHNR